MGANVTTELKGFNLVQVVWIIYAEDGRIAALAKIPVQDSKNSTISKVLVIVSILNYGENKAVQSEKTTSISFHVPIRCFNNLLGHFCKI